MFMIFVFTENSCMAALVVEQLLGMQLISVIGGDLFSSMSRTLTRRFPGAKESLFK